MLSAKQTQLYWRTWAALVREHGWHGEPELTERRRALHAVAGCPESMRKFTNADMDRFLRAARASLAGKNHNPSISSEAGERRRLIWRIREDSKSAGLDPAYVEQLARDLTGLGCYEELAIDDLRNLRNLVHNRCRTQRAQRPQATRKYSLNVG